MLSDNIDYAWTRNLKKCGKPLLVIESSRSYKGRLYMGVSVQLVDDVFKLDQVFSILFSSNTSSNTFTTEFITYNKIDTNRSEAKTEWVARKICLYFYNHTQFPWIYLVALWNSIINKIISVARVPISDPNTPAFIVPPWQCIQAKCDNGPENIRYKSLVTQQVSLDYIIQSNKGYVRKNSPTFFSPCFCCSRESS